MNKLKTIKPHCYILLAVLSTVVHAQTPSKQQQEWEIQQRLQTQNAQIAEHVKAAREDRLRTENEAAHQKRLETLRVERQSTINGIETPPPQNNMKANSVKEGGVCIDSSECARGLHCFQAKCSSFKSPLTPTK